MKQFFIYDTTLRDGSQAYGISYTVEDKLNILKALDNLGISYIEGGNPHSNPTDYEFFKKAKDVKLKNSTLVAFSSTKKANTPCEEDEGLKALTEAETKTVCIVGKAWDMQVEEVLKTNKEENLKMISETVAFLVKNNKEVIFDAEHYFEGYKANPSYALKCIKAAEAAGADFIVLCDTNGGCFVEEIGEITLKTRLEVNVKLGIHTHNDMGLSEANTFEAVDKGASLIQGTFLGLGERCGNANLSTIIPSLQLKKGYACIKEENLKDLTTCANLIADISNVILPSTMPYVGTSAFSHKGGMHIDAVEKNPLTFEHINPLDIGNERVLLFSDLAGRSLLLKEVLKIDSTLKKDSKEVISLMEMIKEKEFKGYQYEVANASLKLLLLKHFNKLKDYFTTELFRVIGEQHTKESTRTSSALIKIKVGEEFEITAAEGEGPVNALDEALRKALIVFYPSLKEMKLIDYKVRVVNPNDATKAKVRVLIESKDKLDSWTTVGVSEDIINASFKALVDSIEYKLYKDSL